MYVHCNSCHHEWECTNNNERTCDWCGDGSYILESDIPLIPKDDVLTALRKLNNPFADRVIKKIIKHPNK
jgi:hypothetical protein